ncbi:MAG TPA: carbohydrate ABC transporter permease [Spirochaetia bacterium]|nr:carbohydrate ABC transporter permease [Spirochaetia bacterium]
MNHSGAYSRRRLAIGAVFLIVMSFLAAYFLLPLVWLLVSSSKSTAQLFSTPMFQPSSMGGYLTNLKELGVREGGAYWRWYLNSIIYSTVTGVFGTGISALAGYALAKYQFRLRGLASLLVLVALLLPGATLTIPDFLLIKKLGLMDSYAAVILPMLASPFGVYFMNVYIGQSMPSELIDSGRIDGASDYQIFGKIAVPIISPGLVTLFLITFIFSWNNFFLPLLVLSSTKRFPVTLGLEIWVSKLISPSTGIPPYPLIVMGSLLSVLPMVVLFPFLRKFIAAGIAAGSVKT